MLPATIPDRLSLKLLRKRSRTIILPAVLLAFSLLALAGCSETSDLRWISLHSSATTASGGSSTSIPLRMAVAAVVSPAETVKSYLSLSEYLSKRLERPVEIVQRQTYAEINNLVRTGEVDFALVCNGGYVAGNRDFGMELLVVPQIGGSTSDQSLVVVLSSSQVQNLLDLRQKTFAFSDPLSFTGWLAPRYLLWRMGERPEHFFRRVIFTYSHDNSLRALLDRVVDGAAVDGIVYQQFLSRHPEYRGKFRVIAHSLAAGNPPVVVNPQLEAGLKRRLKELFLSMHKDKEGQEALGAMLVDRFVPAQDSAYDPIRIMEKEMTQER
ncbi:MAG: phosphate/phosphite/phosphonate ABC transporter substrate-binding protein [Firmicutes bacterium]|nr:phosphate/phosphite/phosphonate ABC transporter substrate-binding protein [Bacillota bacterium]MCL5039277.1 phosphate/phosphite/phosphonate ABC transporter substrate-binding protein [Bacillota bacterium]